MRSRSAREAVRFGAAQRLAPEGSAKGGGAADARALTDGWTKPSAVARAWRRDKQTWQAVIAPEGATEGRAILITLSNTQDTWHVTELGVSTATPLWTEI